MITSFSSHKATLKPAILIVGKPGSGKTTLAAMLGRPYIIELDNNIEGPFRFLAGNNFPCKATANTPQLVDGNLVARGSRWALMNKACVEAVKSPDYDTIVIDSWTSFVELALLEVARQQGRRVGNPVDGQPDEGMLIQDWKAFQSLVFEWIHRLKSSGKTVVVLAHIEDDKDSNGVIREYIKMPGSSRDVVSGLFTECWRCRVVSDGSGAKLRNKYMISTVGSGTSEPLGLKSAMQLPADYEVNFEELNKKLFA